MNGGNDGEHRDDQKLIESLEKLIGALVRGYLPQRPDIARELVQRARIACDECTSLINDSTRKAAQ